MTHKKLKRKRQFIINEIVETEKRYIEKLKTLYSVFILPLFTLESDCKLLGKLCAQIQLFLRFHRVLLNDLLNGMSIPSVFIKTGFFLELTRDYMNLYPEASNIIETHRYKSKKFRELIKNSELFHQVQLSQLLIEPMERIPRYKMLLQDLQASTPIWHPEFANLEQALQKIVKIMLKLKEAQDTDKYGAGRSVYQKINGRGHSLWTPIRKFVRKDVFWCVFQCEYCHFFPPSRVRVFLFTNCIIICEDQIVSKRYKFLSEISLSGISSLEYVQDLHISCKRHKMSADVLGIRLSAIGHRSFELYHSNHAVLKKWFKLLSKSETVATRINRKENSSNPNQNLLFRKKTASPTIAGYMSFPEVGSAYGSVSRSEPGSLCNSDGKSMNSSENVVTLIDHGTEVKSSSDKSDYHSFNQATPIRENLRKLSKARSCYIKLSDSQ